MTILRDRNVERITRELSRYSGTRRAERLHQICGEDQRLRAEVQRRLKRTSDAHPERFLTETQAPTLIDGLAGTVALPPSLRIGSYELLSVLGEGSMGVVYRARQDKPHRIVALKLLKAGNISERALINFEHEAQLLGRLQHPAIGQIFEAGTATSGGRAQPYFAMELVDGVAIHKYADWQHLDYRQRLSLLIRVCEGVQHAHQRRVIHRDLKPGNILVDASGQPKILDFGISLAVDSDETVHPKQAAPTQLAGTIPYMSPEQMQGDAHGIDLRTDVYALGVVAFQVLTGNLPYDNSGKSTDEALRTAHQGKRLRIGAVDRRLRGDLELIVDKALELDKSCRYQSAADLAADFRRFLDDKPILARTPSPLYLLRKYAKRNKAIVAGSAVAVLTFLAAVGLVGMYARRTAHSTETTARVNKFLTSEVLGAPNPYDMGRAVTVEEALDRAAKSLNKGELRDDPQAVAEIRAVLGETYRSLGLLSKSDTHLTISFDMLSRLHGPLHERTLRCMNELGLLRLEQGRNPAAGMLLRSALEQQTQLLGDEHQDTLETQHNLAILLEAEGDLAGSEQLHRKTLDAYRRTHGEYNRETVTSKNSLALVLSLQDKYEPAEMLYREALTDQLAEPGVDHPLTLITMNNLALVLKMAGRSTEAVDLYDTVLDARKRVLGHEHPETLTTMNNLASLLKSIGRLSESESLYNDVIEKRQRILGVDHPKTLISKNNLAMLLKEQGRWEEAERLQRDSLARLSATLGANHQTTITAMHALALLLSEQGKVAEAESLHRNALQRRRDTLDPDHAKIAESIMRLAVFLSENDRPYEAVPLLREALTIRMEAWSEGDWRIANTRSRLGACLVDLGRLSEAEPLLLESYPIIQKQWGDSYGYAERAMNRIVKLYEKWDKPQLAAEYRRRLKDD